MGRHMGSDAVQRLLAQLGPEWLHLKVLRQKYVRWGTVSSEAPGKQEIQEVGACRSLPVHRFLIR